MNAHCSQCNRWARARLGYDCASLPEAEVGLQVATLTRKNSAANYPRVNTGRNAGSVREPAKFQTGQEFRSGNLQPITLEVGSEPGPIEIVYLTDANRGSRLRSAAAWCELSNFLQDEPAL